MPSASANRWKRFVCWTLGILAILGIAGWLLVASQLPGHRAPGPIAEASPTDDPVLFSIRRGMEYLKSIQEDDGEFSRGLLDPKPAFTALVVDACARSPDRLSPRSEAWLERAVEAILRHRQTDGGIYTPGFKLDNYTTAVSLMALVNTDAERHGDAIAGMRAYLLAQQNASGGWGYYGGGRPDGSNTALAVEALNESGLPKDSEAYKRVQSFLATIQNNSEFNSAEWVSDDKGFVYRPGETKPAPIKMSDGRTVLASYGMMSYAGLSCFLYAYVDRHDPRVRSAYDWVKTHFDLEGNVNLPKPSDGQYYYYLALAKALQAYGERHITTADGVVHDWPRELAAQAMALQQSRGEWINQKSDRWMENDHVMCTAFMVRTLSICHEVIHGRAPSGLRSIADPRVRIPVESASP